MERKLDEESLRKLGYVSVQRLRELPRFDTYEDYYDGRSFITKEYCDNGEFCNWDDIEALIWKENIEEPLSSVNRLKELGRVIDDGFGNIWSLCNRENCGLELVRPGQVQCWCDEEDGLGKDFP